MSGGCKREGSKASLPLACQVELDQRRNELVACDLVLTCIATIFTFVAMVGSVRPLTDFPKKRVLLGLQELRAA